MLEDLTILIITFNRPNYLLRLLVFLQKYNYNFKIIILDSSINKIQDKKLINLIEKDANISIFKFISDISIQEKIYKGLNKINTEYCVLSTDDDFLIPSCFKKCIDFLHNNPDYCSAQGRYYSHSTNVLPKKYNFNLFSIYDNKTISNDFDSTNTRITKYFKGQVIIYPFYAIHKTKDFKDIHIRAFHNTDSFFLHEFFISALSLIKGKMKIFPDFYCSKEPNAFNPITNEFILNNLSESRIKKVSLELAKNLSSKNNEKININEIFFTNFLNFKKNNALENINKKNSSKSINVKFYFLKRILKSIFLYNSIIGIHNLINGIKIIIKYKIKIIDLLKLKSAIESFVDTKDELSSIRKKY